jgi:hypothetical protein
MDELRVVGEGREKGGMEGGGCCKVVKGAGAGGR